jgi:hypothetical protein
MVDLYCQRPIVHRPRDGGAGASVPLGAGSDIEGERGDHERGDSENGHDFHVKLYVSKIIE